MNLARTLLLSLSLPLGLCATETNSLIQSSTVGIGTNTVLKGLAIKVGLNHEATFCFDTELLRMAGGWTGGFVTPVNLMSRGEYPTSLGPLLFTTTNRPGWSRVAELNDPRPKPLGPLPPDWARYRGLYVNDDWVVLHYTVGSAEVFELPDFESAEKMFTRTFSVGRTTGPSSLLVCEVPPHPGKRDIIERVGNGRSGYVALNGGTNLIAVGVQGAPSSASFEIVDRQLYFKLPQLADASRFRLTIWKGDQEEGFDHFVEYQQQALPVLDARRFSTNGAARWPEPVVTKGQLSPDNAAYVVDTLTLPSANPWKSEMLLAGFDFFSDGTRAAVCTFHGDVWIVSGIDDKLEKLTWKRFAAGLYHALGLKIVNDEIYVTGRDQITRLRDLNGDGEADFYECSNNDCQVTKNFHEFAMDLQTDAAGNFYFGKAGPVRNGGRGFEEISEHHGCLLKVPADGKKLEVVATGFRAPNGVCIGPKGELTVSDNEGTWTPVCRLNWVKPGGFYGCVDLAHRTPPPTGYDPPLCWLPKSVDNSSAGQVWATSDRWGALNGSLLHLSYGTCLLFNVLKEEVDGVMQGGVVRLPLRFDSGIMRARFNPRDGQLYVVGMKGWQTSAARDGCFQRVRYTGKPFCAPLDLNVKSNGVAISFTAPLDPATANDADNFAVEVWNYIWSAAYGSPEISTKAVPPKPGDNGKEWDAGQLSTPQHDAAEVKSAKLSADGKTVFLELVEVKPVMQMRIKFNLKAADGSTVQQEIFNTINKVPK
jgi:hypothetical protein